MDILGVKAVLEVCHFDVTGSPVYLDENVSMKLYSPGIQVLAAESKALSAAISCIEQEGDRKAAVDLLRQIFHQMSTEGIEDWVVKVAMGRILGEPGNLIAPVKLVTSSDWQLFEIVARSWVSWVYGEPGIAHEILGRSSKLSHRGSSVHVTALEFWQKAVEALITRDPSARRLFHRAAEFGSQYGTESNPAVQWSYAASFFHVPASSS